ncbi:MAG: hypothetical protein ACFFD9_09280 [Candidatus Thorarchaeota archaeon]
MEGIRPSSSPRGVGIIADIQILFGIAYSVLGLLVLFYAIAYGLLLIIGGAILIATGWALGDLHVWAWWGSVLTNVGILVGVLIGVLMDISSAGITLFSNIIGVAMAITIIAYLSTPGVRTKFQIGHEDRFRLERESNQL